MTEDDAVADDPLTGEEAHSMYSRFNSNISGKQLSFVAPTKSFRFLSIMLQHLHFNSIYNLGLDDFDCKLGLQSDLIHHKSDFSTLIPQKHNALMFP